MQLLYVCFWILMKLCHRTPKFFTNILKSTSLSLVHFKWQYLKVVTQLFLKIAGMTLVFIFADVTWPNRWCLILCLMSGIWGSLCKFEVPKTSRKFFGLVFFRGIVLVDLFVCTYMSLRLLFMHFALIYKYLILKLISMNSRLFNHWAIKIKQKKQLNFIVMKIYHHQLSSIAHFRVAYFLFSF